MNNPKIAILSTVDNKELYKKSSLLFPQNIQKYVIDGTNGMYGIESIFYMMKILKGKEIDWLIMADEDVLFKNSDLVFEIINKMELEKYTVCGCREGGQNSIRRFNPYVINTYFSILNFREIEKIWNKSEIKKNQYINKDEFNDDLSNLIMEYDTLSLYEPYYCFYLWLKRNGKKFLFLETQQGIKDDIITTLVYFENKLLLYHTWYARTYGISEWHTNRINKIFDLFNCENKNSSKPIIFKHKIYFLIRRLRKFRQRIIMRIDKTLNYKT